MIAAPRLKTGPATISFAGAYLVTMRPYLLFVSGITGIAGMSFGGSTDPTVLISVFAACFLSYGFGQALTDCFQTDTDAISSPYRPLTRGAISRRATLAVSVAGLTGCVALLGYWNPLNLLLGLLAGAGLSTYTWFKRRWWGGPGYNAWIVSVLFLMGALASGYRFEDDLPSFLWTAAGTFFAYANFVLAGYFKDIEADRATGYETLPVVFGRRTATIVSHGFAVAQTTSIVVLLVLAAPLPPTGAGGLFFLIASVLALVRGQWNLHRNRCDDSAHRAIVPIVHSYLLCLAGTASIRNPEWFLPIAGFYLVFSFVLAQRPEPHQI